MNGEDRVCVRLMSMKRDATGKFTSNWDLETKRRVSLTLTNTAWQLLEAAAQKYHISRSEVIERIARGFSTVPEDMVASETEVIVSAQDEGDRNPQDVPLQEQNQLMTRLIENAPDSIIGEPMLACPQAADHCQPVEQALRQSEERLRVANERFQLAAKAVNCLIYDWDVPADQVTRTDGLTRLLGYSLAEAEPTGKWWSDRIHPDDLSQVQEQAWMTLVQADYFTAEYRVRHQSNQYIYVLDQCLVVARDSQGNPTRIVGSTTDISDRKRVEDDLRAIEQRLQLAQWAGKIGTWEWHLLTNKVSWSDGVWALLAVEPNSISLNLESFTSFIHPDDRGQAFQRVEEALAQKQEYYAEFRVIRPDGTIRWLLSKGQVICTSEGQPERLLGINVDITDRKQSEAALAKSNQTLQAMIAACPLAIMGLRSDGIVRIWNPAAERIFGWSQQEVLGKFLPTIPANKQEEFLHNLAITSQGQGLAGVETQRQKKGNILLDVELWLAPVNETEADISCLSVIADITERRQAEAALQESRDQFHALADHIAQLAWMADRHGNIFWYNQRWFDYTGSTLAAMQGWGWQTIHHPDYVEQVTEKFRRHIESGETWEDTFPLRGKDGQYRWFLSRAIPIRDQQGQVLRWCGTNTDITDRQQAEAEREQLLQREQLAREQAEAANRVKDEFLAVLSHELRTPLNPILGWAKLLRSRHFDAAAVDRALDTIERNAKLQAQLIEDLLDVSRILQGKLSLNVHSVNLVETIAASLATVQLSAEAKGIQLQTHLDPTVGQVNGDANRLQQIVWNLLSNAVKFTPSGGQIEVRLAQITEGAGLEDMRSHGGSSAPSLIHTYAQIQVKDTGQGISPSFLPYVFEYFRQADSSTTRKFGGLGLGLAIVQHLVEQHGGTIEAESPGVGLGAMFTVRLPIATGKVKGMTTLELPDAAADLTDLHILVVDDEADMRDLAKFILIQQGAQVTVAGSATEAITTLSQCLPDVLLCDIGMPGMDGYTLLQQIRERSRDAGGLIPAIALTAYAGDTDRRQALAAGFQRHMAKPIEPEALVKAIMQVVNQG